MEVVKKISNIEAIRYIFYAILTSIINIGIYLLFYNYISQNILISNIIAYIISIILSFWLNKTRVYKQYEGNTYYQLFKFLLIKISAFIIDSIVLYLCFNLLGLSNAISKLISNCSTALSNYTLNKKVVFK